MSGYSEWATEVHRLAATGWNEEVMVQAATSLATILIGSRTEKDEIIILAASAGAVIGANGKSAASAIAAGCKAIETWSKIAA